METDWFRRATKEQLGDFGELVWRNVLIEAGYRLIVLSKIEDGGAPMMQGKEKLILPDFQAMSCKAYRDILFLDSKVKSGPVYLRIRSQWRHGINKVNYEHYLKCGELAGAPAGIGIVECFTDEANQTEWSGSLLIQSFRNLGEPCPEIQRERPQKVYWPRKCFGLLGRFTPTELSQIAHGSRVPNYEAKLKIIFSPTTQGELF